MRYNKLLISLLGINIVINLALFPATVFADLNDGLVAHYPLDGNVLDFGGSAHNGAAYNGATPTNDRDGNPNSAFAFDGIDDYLQIPHFDALNLSRNGFAVSFYVRIHPEQYASDGLFTIVDKSHGDCFGTASGWAFQGRNGSDAGPGFVYGDGRNFIGITGSAYLQDDQWHHMVSMIDADQFYLYIDGQLFSKSQLQDDPTSNMGSLFMGKWGCNNTRFFHGAIDDLKIYHRTLTNEEIAILNDPSQAIPPVEPEICPPPAGTPPLDPEVLRPATTAALTIEAVEVDAETGEIKLKLNLDPGSVAWAALIRDPQLRLSLEMETADSEGLVTFGLVGDTTVPLATDSRKHRYGEIFSQELEACEDTTPSKYEYEGDHKERRDHNKWRHASEWWDKQFRRYRSNKASLHSHRDRATIHKLD